MDQNLEATRLAKVFDKTATNKELTESILVYLNYNLIIDDQ